MGPGKEWAPRRRAVPVLLGARAAQPAVAVGAQDVRCPLLLALGAVLQAQRSAVTDPSFSGGMPWVWTEKTESLILFLDFGLPVWGV